VDMNMMEHEEKMEYRKWMNEIPFIEFPKNSIVKMVPPYLGAVVRFQVANKEKPDKTVSVYLDCYDNLAHCGHPYWEIYPDEQGNNWRCGINEVDELSAMIDLALKFIGK